LIRKTYQGATTLKSELGKIVSSFKKSQNFEKLVGSIYPKTAKTILEVGAFSQVTEYSVSSCARAISGESGRIAS
jgi:hypothetical protein